jgi:sulfur relay (sulfurtransferase) complex TusBCD TusD component (DsrE family)
LHTSVGYGSFPLAMASFVLIESRNPFETSGGCHIYDLAESLARANNRVTVFLVQDGVLAARAGEHTFWFAQLTKAGVVVLADDASVRQRGLIATGLSRSVRTAPRHVVADHIAAGAKALWH